MKKMICSAGLVSLVMIMACTSGKNATTSTVTGTSPSNTTTGNGPVNTFPFSAVPPTYAPGEKELGAIQQKYQGTTMEQLQKGHLIYTAGECITCHLPEDIYRIPEEKWKGLIDDMGKRAALSDEQKDAVFKYVLSVKSTQPK